jgi:hypothetical protein
VVINGIGREWPADLLVAYGHHGRPPNRWHKVAHLNGDHADNRAENLAYYEDTFDFYDRMMRESAAKRRRAPYAGDYGHGRDKVGRFCSRGHELSTNAKPDNNTAMHGYGNRICRRCWADELTDIVVSAHAGSGRW